MLGRYKILGDIGEGGFAKVLLARDENSRDVAIKRMREEGAGMRLHEAFFYNEMQALRRIDHAGVVRLIDCGRDNTLPFLVLEYFDGEPLHLANREFVKRKMPKIAASVCEALDAVHYSGIIHGDLIPGNIMIRRLNGGASVKILDFGASTVGCTTPCAGWDSMRVGGAAYASPENQMGREHMDARSDLFTLGAVMYDMMAEVPYFAMLGMNEARDPGRYDRYPPLIAGVSHEVNYLIRKALSRDPKDRFRNAKEMGSSLEACL